MIRVHANVLAVLALVACADAVAAPPRYVAVPLGTLGGAYSEGRAINVKGDVTGAAQVATGELHAFAFSGGAMRDLDDGGYGSQGNAINASGHVTGCVLHGDRNYGFVHYGDGMRDIETLAISRPEQSSPTRLGCGVAIDDGGRVLGGQYWDFQYAVAPSYLYFEGVVVDVPQSAAALNNRGDMAGTRYFHVNAPQGWVLVDGIFTGLTTFGDPESYANAINEQGVATVRYVDGGRALAFIYNRGARTQIVGFDGSEDVQGLAINDLNQVVGVAHGPDGGARAFLYTDGSGYDLNALVVSGLGGATLTAAPGINDKGMIVANSCSPGPAYPPPCVAFRLDPLDDPASPANVPALSPVLLAALSLLLLSAGFARLRR